MCVMGKQRQAWRWRRGRKEVEEEEGKKQWKLAVRTQGL
uniref:Uncharacterized protein n=1 Tax=Populus trichocarpa TaxID=3694 RepID=A9PAF6_POPTR|nr:unknown [Populus trichocarpa]